MEKIISLVGYVLEKVFSDINNPFTLLFGAFFCLMLFGFVFSLIKGDRVK